MTIDEGRELLRPIVQRLWGPFKSREDEDRMIDIFDQCITEELDKEIEAMNEEQRG